MDGAMFMRRLFYGRHFLEIVWQDNTGDSAHHGCDTECPVYQMSDLFGNGSHKNKFVSYIFKQVYKINFLLVSSPQRTPRLLADDGNHRLMIHFCIIESI